MKGIVKRLILAALVVLPVSCTTPAKLAYLRDMQYNTPYLAKQAPELRLQVDDKISIQVFSTDVELAAPFNVGSGLVGESGQTLGYVGCTGTASGYHLHFEVRVGGAVQNPRDWFDFEIITMQY